MNGRVEARSPATRIAAGLAIGGAAMSALALADDPRRFAFAWLWAFAIGWTTVVGSLFFLALQHLTKSRWSIVIRRVAEAIASCTWVMAVLVVPILVFAWMPDTFHLFPWLDPALRDGDPVIAGKTPYLNPAFLTIRTAAFFLAWVLFARFFIGRSLAQDRGERPTENALAMRRASPAFMLVFAGSVTFMSFDLLMSLNPYWFSTIFGVYVFSGMFLSALAVITLAVIWLRAKGMLGEDVVRGDHLFSLGAFLFAMSCFWAYIAFSQYLLIWTGHLPEETAWFAQRFEGGWLAVAVLLVGVRFVVPFLVLMSRAAKTRPRLLVAMALLTLFGQALDLYWVIEPAAGDGGWAIGWQEAGPFLLVAGALGLAFAGFLRRHPAMATGDPRFEDSTHFQL